MNSDMTIEEFCDRHSACSVGREWALANCKSMSDAWATAKPEWLVWIAPRPGVLTDRELRIFAVSCARRVQHLMSDPRSIAALDVAERFANGQAAELELAEAKAAAMAAARYAAMAAARYAAMAAASDAAMAAARYAAMAAASDAARYAAWAAARAAAMDAARYAASDAARAAAWAAAWSAEMDAQSSDLRKLTPNFSPK